MEERELKKIISLAERLGVDVEKIKRRIERFKKLPLEKKVEEILETMGIIITAPVTVPALLSALMIEEAEKKEKLKEVV